MIRARVLAFFLMFPGFVLHAQVPEAKSVNQACLQHLQWQNIGPKRGGRSIAVCGSTQRSNEYYFGATGGGLWKTGDGGNSWNPLTDHQIGSSSVGAVAVAPSDPDIVYLGMGEAQLRQNVLQGDGVYRSSNGGQTWKHMGLAETQVISRIRVHPKNPDIVYVAALGHPFGPNPERGVFKSTDGGESWEKILYRGEKSGAMDLAMDPSNPDILYATLWEVYRKPWLLWSGGPGSGLYKSTDGGESWKDLKSMPGLPEGIWGKSTVTVSGADPDRVWVNIEAGEGGLYRSDDGAKTFKLVNNHRDLWQRAFYFLRIQADPVDRDRVYVLSFKLIRSDDGGESFSYLPHTHSDHHDLWIDPENPERMINGNDGGGVVSVNGGQTWTHMRYPTAQIYRLSVTNDFPYHVAGGQQDNSTVVVPSDGGYLRNQRLEPGEMMYAAGGGENGYVVQHPTKLNIFYSGKTNALNRYDRNTGLVTDVQPWPRIVMGESAGVMPERWNWNYPIVVSPLEPDALFVGSQYLWKSPDQGRTWEKISPDLTAADPNTMKDSGGPIVFDQDGPEIYATIYAIEPSPLEKDVFWVGSDDGLVHLKRNGGTDWENVTPNDMPVNSKVCSIEASPHDPAVAFLVARRYEMDDRAPYVWRTGDYGKSWQKIISGIGADDFAHAICEDPLEKDLLFLGCEHGVYVSFNGGEIWQPFSNNMPDTPVMGIAVKQNDLVVATHGRSYWKMSNIALLRQLGGMALADKAAHLFSPHAATRRAVPAVIDVYLRDAGKNLTLDICDSEGELIRPLVRKGNMAAGMHRVQWNLRYEGATSFPGIVLEGGDPARGPWAPPGVYKVRLSYGDEVQIREFEIVKDPRLAEVSKEDLEAQFELAMKIRDCETAANQTVIAYRHIKEELENRLAASSSRKLKQQATFFLEEAEAIASELYQLKNQSPKDKIANPIKLNDRLTGLRSHLESGDMAPTASYYAVFDELNAELETQLTAWSVLMETELVEFNHRLSKLNLEIIKP